MSRSAEYKLSWSETRQLYELSRSSTQELLPVIPDGAEWFTWLSHVSSFAFRGKRYAFTARCEHPRRGGTYWYAYSRIRKKVRKKYLGRTADLCSERLERVATLLHSESIMQVVLNDFPPDQSEEQALAAQAYKRPDKGKNVPPTPLLTTKLCIPCLPVHLVLRIHLFDQLYHVLHYPLTLITSSAGSGKTTLLSSWLHSSSLHALWISLDAEDDNPLHFWSYFFVALNTSVGGIADVALSFLRLQQPPPLETLLTLVINNLAQSVTQLILVLDDYHLITDPAIQRGITFLLDHQPATLHLVLSTRVDPPLPLDRFRMHGRLLELRSKMLYFTHDEVTNFLTLTTRFTFSDEDIASLYMRTEGWVAGLQLFALSLQGKDEYTQPLRDFTGGHRYIFDYLLQEIVTRQSAQMVWVYTGQ